jgi:hypothetical protein
MRDTYSKMYPLTVYTFFHACVCRAIAYKHTYTYACIHTYIHPCAKGSHVGRAKNCLTVGKSPIHTFINTHTHIHTYIHAPAGSAWAKGSHDARSEKLSQSASLVAGMIPSKAFTLNPVADRWVALLLFCVSFTTCVLCMYLYIGLILNPVADRWVALLLFCVSFTCAYNAYLCKFCSAHYLLNHVAFLRLF